MRKNTINYIVINSLFIGLIYYGLVNKVEGALNIALIVTWISSFFGLLTIIIPKEEIKKMVEKEKNRAVPKTINIMVDITVFSLFIWHGFWMTGLAWTIGMLYMNIFLDKMDEVRKEILNAEQDKNATQSLNFFKQ